MSIGKCKYCSATLPERPAGKRGKRRTVCDECRVVQKKKQAKSAANRQYQRAYQHAHYKRERAQRLAGRTCVDCKRPLSNEVHGRNKRCDICNVLRMRNAWRRSHGPHVRVRAPRAWQPGGLTGRPCDECGLPYCAFQKTSRMCLTCAATRYRETVRIAARKKWAERALR